MRKEAYQIERVTAPNQTRKQNITFISTPCWPHYVYKAEITRREQVNPTGTPQPIGTIYHDPSTRLDTCATIQID
jgi:hypothetical protein